MNCWIGKNFRGHDLFNWKVSGRFATAGALMQCLVAFDSYLQYPFGRVIETLISGGR